MEQGGTLYGVFQYVRPACGQGSGVFLQPDEENGVFHDSYLYHLRKARAFEGEGLGVQKEEVVQGGPGHGEGDQIVFLPHEIDAVYDAYAGIRLGEGAVHAAADAAEGSAYRSPPRPERLRRPRRRYGNDGRSPLHDVAQGASRLKGGLAASPPGTVRRPA